MQTGIESFGREDAKYLTLVILGDWKWNVSKAAEVRRNKQAIKTFYFMYFILFDF